MIRVEWNRDCGGGEPVVLPARPTYSRIVHCATTVDEAFKYSARNGTAIIGAYEAAISTERLKPMGVRHRLLDHRKIGTPAQIRARGSEALLADPSGVRVREVPGSVGKVVKPRYFQIDVRQLA